MRKFYTNLFLLTFFGLLTNFTSFGQIVANTDNIQSTCGYYGNNPSENVLFNDTINGNPFSYTDVTITIINNPYNGIIDLDIDPLSPSYGFLIMYNPTIYGQFTIAYQICEVANPTNCDIGYITLYNQLAPVMASDDDFGSNPIDNTVGGTTTSVLNNDYSPCYGLIIGNSYVYPNSSLPTGLTLNPDGTISVAVATIPGVYIISYTICDNLSGTCDYASAFVYVTGITDVVANYDDFSNPNYPNSITPSVLNNDTVNGNPADAFNVNLTPLNVPSGFSFNANGTINIASNVSEGTYFVSYQLCSIANPSQCYVNYAYVVVLKNRILGKVKFDANNNGCDTGDAYLSNIHAKNINSTTTSTSYSNYYGNQYYLIGDAGTNTVSINLPSYFTVTPSDQVFNLSAPGTISAPDFCVTANTNVDDLEVVLIPLFNVVPGLPAIYNVWYKNNGSTTLNGQVTIQFNNTKMSFLSSSPSPNTTASGTITYAFSGLAPFENRLISNVKFQIAIPPTNNSGDVVSVSSTITPVAADATPSNNSNTLNQTVVNSQDPNDIIVHEGATVTLSQAQQGYLHYTIRFQNVGTSDAINIKVVNDLDTKLDWSTFELIGTSHNCRIKNKNGHNEFLFEGINLPGTANEPLSHGYISYKVKPISSIAVGNVISNNANIYFDYNAPIATNTATTTVVNNLSNESFAFSNLNFYPNPVKNNLTISNTSTIETVEISSILGQKIIVKKINDLQTEIDLSQLLNGVYFVKVISEGKEKTVKIIKE